MAPSALVASTGSSIQFGGGMDSSVAPVLFVLLVLAPIALSAARFMWKRARVPARPAASPDESRRLERLEQGVDAIAIEVERISEGQRFVTRLLSEAHDGVTVPVTQRVGEGARVGGDAPEPGQGATK
jgi:hypothetical protein